MSQVLCTVAPGQDVAGLTLVTNMASMDEPCFGLSEVHLQSPGSRGVHRYQVLGVIRGDRLAQFMRDLGPAENFAQIDQFRVPGGVRDDRTGRYEVVHTVGELIDIADYLRMAPSILTEIPEGTLWEDWMLQLEERQRAGRSSFSSNHSLQRS